MPVKKQQNILAASPFDLHDDRTYGIWREQKLASYPRTLGDILVDISDPHALNDGERAAIRQACQVANMAFYTVRGEAANSAVPDKSLVADLGRQFGLQHLDSNLYADDDGISSLQVAGGKRQFDYIPYSNKGISWHTDGYYNRPEKTIRAMILHCVNPAAEGGDNSVADHEMIYLQMRDENPRYIEALMQPTAMTIPANIENGVEIRPEQTGPVFSVDQLSGQLQMRYTARKRSIVWQEDETTRAAVRYLEQILAADSPYVFKHRMAAGQGIICNNVLHNRSGFRDDADTGQQRLYFRARYYDRIV